MTDDRISYIIKQFNLVNKWTIRSFSYNQELKQFNQEHKQFNQELKQFTQELKMQNEQIHESSELSEKIQQLEKELELAEDEHKRQECEQLKLTRQALLKSEIRPVFPVLPIFPLFKKLKEKYLDLFKQFNDKQALLFKQDQLSRNQITADDEELTELEATVGHLDLETVKTQYIELEATIDQLEKDHWVRTVMLLAHFTQIPTQANRASLQDLPADVLLHILGFVPVSAFISKKHDQLMNCASFIMSNQASLQTAIAQGQSAQVIERPTAEAERFSWRFFTEKVGHKREREIALEREDAVTKKAHLSLN